MKWEDLTAETITKTEQWFIDNALGCIAEAESGEVFVNDFESYKAWQMEIVKKYTDKTYRPTLSFLLKAWYIQTGECPALLP